MPCVAAGEAWVPKIKKAHCDIRNGPPRTSVLFSSSRYRDGGSRAALDDLIFSFLFYRFIVVCQEFSYILCSKPNQTTISALQLYFKNSFRYSFPVTYSFAAFGAGDYFLLENAFHSGFPALNFFLNFLISSTETLLPSASVPSAFILLIFPALSALITFFSRCLSSSSAISYATDFRYP